MRKRRWITFFTLICIAMLAAVCMTSCKDGKAEGRLVENTETLVVIEVTETDGEATLFDVMEILQEEGKLTYTLSGTMIHSIGEKENAADFSACWMLYTSDTEMGNTEWGTYDYKGTSCASAILGGDALTLVKGAYYVWVYTSF